MNADDPETAARLRRDCVRALGLPEDATNQDIDAELARHRTARPTRAEPRCPACGQVVLFKWRHYVVLGELFRLRCDPHDIRQEDRARKRRQSGSADRSEGLRNPELVLSKLDWWW